MTQRTLSDEAPQVPLAELSAALDEVYLLRALLAREARVAEEHGRLKTFPASRRADLERSIADMRAAAGGGAREVFADTPVGMISQMLSDAGVKTGLTRGMFAQEQEERAARDEQ